MFETLFQKFDEKIELTAEEKADYSHRGVAFRKALDWLDTLLEG